MEKIMTLKCGPVNCYLITNDSSAVLIDTATEQYNNYLLKKLESYNIKLIILTHGHIDHVGNTAFLANKFNAKIAMHELDYELSQDNSIRKLNAKSFLGKILKKASESSFKTTKISAFKPDFFLHDHQSLSEFGINAEVISLPGHTAGSIGILLKHKELIIGDTLMNIFRPGPSLIAEDFQMLKQSIHKVKQLKSEIIYVGHGRPIRPESVKLNFYSAAKSFKFHKK